MKKTVCELFAGVGGFRCGLNNIREISDAKKHGKWETIWFNQWEPSNKTTQWAWACYTGKFGTCFDKNGKDTTNTDISMINPADVPDHNLLVGGFPCQDYSVANGLNNAKGIQGKKGVLFWPMLAIIHEKKPPFILLENVDRLLKSPAKQRGRDFGIILACLRDEGYDVEWRVVNAADYGFQQRRRRVFVFAYSRETAYGGQMGQFMYRNGLIRSRMQAVMVSKGFFAQCFPVNETKEPDMVSEILPVSVSDVSDYFSFRFENTGIMADGVIYTAKTIPEYHGGIITLGDVMEENVVPDSFFYPRREVVLY